MAKSNENSSQALAVTEVREKLLDVAEQLFCDKGFEGASIRDITSNAGCNVASVNYHFGGKDNLYSEVFRRRLIAMRDVRIASIDKVLSKTDHEPTLEELIRAFATAFIEPLLEQSSGRRFIKLMVREMSEPHLPRKMFVEEIVGPTLSALEKGMARICPGLSKEKMVLSIISIVGQLVHVIRLNDIFDLKDLLGDSAPSSAQMLEHIVEFSAAGIRAAIEEKPI